jgi:NADH dehydrogenase
MGQRMKRIVIIGAGFAGLAAAKALRRADADILVIDRANHNLFQPLLYQVATTVLSPAPAKYDGISRRS